MKISIKSIFRKSIKILRPEFEDQRLTSYSGLILFEALFKCIGLKNKLSSCFEHLTTSPVYKHGTIILLLTVHLILGYRRVRDVCYYQDDEMVKRILGLKQLPDVSTTSRIMKTCDEKCLNNVREISKCNAGVYSRKIFQKEKFSFFIFKLRQRGAS